MPPARLLVLALLVAHARGLAATQNSTRALPIARLCLLGERNSGTNYIERLLHSAFGDRYGAHLSRGAPVFWFKHMFRHTALSGAEVAALAARTDVAWVLAVRSPCDWADGMHRKPWHMCDPRRGRAECKQRKIQMNKQPLRAVSRLAFASEWEWWDNVEVSSVMHSACPFLAATPLLSCVLTWHSSHQAVHGEEFVYRGGVFELRAHKLRLMAQLRDAVGAGNVIVAHLSEIERAPEAFVAALASRFGLTQRAGRKPLAPSTRAHPTRCWSADEWRVADDRVDWALEEQFGWGRGDCRVCGGG